MRDTVDKAGTVDHYNDCDLHLEQIDYSPGWRKSADNAVSAETVDL